MSHAVADLAVDARCTLGEGPVWHARDQALLQSRARRRQEEHAHGVWVRTLDLARALNVDVEQHVAPVRQANKTCGVAPLWKCAQEGFDPQAGVEEGEARGGGKRREVGRQ